MSVAGTVCCCLGQAPEECNCSCVCQYAWEILNDDVDGPQPDTLEAYQGVMYRPFPLVGLSVSAPWTIVLWTNTCRNASEGGTLFFEHDYGGGGGADRDRVLWDNNVHSGGDLYDSIFQIRMTGENTGDDYGDKSVVMRDVSTSLGQCKLRAIQYRPVADPNGGNFTVPELGIHLYAQTLPTPIHLYDTEELGPYDENIGLEMSTGASYIGNRYDIHHPLWNVNFSFFAGCISNFQVYNGWLSEATLDSLWADGAGRIPDAGEPFIDDQWCAPRPWWGVQPGSIAGTELWHLGPEWDEDGDRILDEADNLVHAR